MPKQNEPTDAQILSRLRRSSKPKTAKALGTTAVRLRGIDGVHEAGRVKTGKAGRPAILFTADEPVTTSPEAESRVGGFADDAEERDQA